MNDPLADARPQDFGLRDDLRGWYCSCGERLWPDCDMSAGSIAAEFERHLIEGHGFTREDIDRAVAETPEVRSLP